MQSNKLPPAANTALHVQRSKFSKNHTLSVPAKYDKSFYYKDLGLPTPNKFFFREQKLPILIKLPKGILEQTGRDGKPYISKHTYVLFDGVWMKSNINKRTKQISVFIEDFFYELDKPNEADSFITNVKVFAGTQLEELIYESAFTFYTQSLDVYNESKIAKLRESKFNKLLIPDGVVAKKKCSIKQLIDAQLTAKGFYCLEYIFNLFHEGYFSLDKQSQVSEQRNKDFTLAIKDGSLHENSIIVAKSLEIISAFIIKHSDKAYLRIAIPQILDFLHALGRPGLIVYQHILQNKSVMNALGIVPGEQVEFYFARFEEGKETTIKVCYSAGEKKQQENAQKPISKVINSIYYPEAFKQIHNLLPPVEVKEKKIESTLPQIDLNLIEKMIQQKLKQNPAAQKSISDGSNNSNEQKQAFANAQIKNDENQISVDIPVKKDVSKNSSDVIQKATARKNNKTAQIHNIENKIEDLKWDKDLLYWDRVKLKARWKKLIEAVSFLIIDEQELKNYKKKRRELTPFNFNQKLEILCQQLDQRLRDIKQQQEEDFEKKNEGQKVNFKPENKKSERIQKTESIRARLEERKQQKLHEEEQRKAEQLAEKRAKFEREQQRKLQKEQEKQQQLALQQEQKEQEKQQQMALQQEQKEQEKQQQMALQQEQNEQIKLQHQELKKERKQEQKQEQKQQYQQKEQVVISPKQINLLADDNLEFKPVGQAWKWLVACADMLQKMSEMESVDLTNNDIAYYSLLYRFSRCAVLLTEAIKKLDDTSSQLKADEADSFRQHILHRGMLNLDRKCVSDSLPAFIALLKNEIPKLRKPHLNESPLNHKNLKKLNKISCKFPQDQLPPLLSELPIYKNLHEAGRQPLPADEKIIRSIILNELFPMIKKLLPAIKNNQLNPKEKIQAEEAICVLFIICGELWDNYLSKKGMQQAKIVGDDNLQTYYKLLSYCRRLRNPAAHDLIFDKPHLQKCIEFFEALQLNTLDRKEQGLLEHGLFARFRNFVQNVQMPSQQAVQIQYTQMHSQQPLQNFIPSHVSYVQNGGPQFFQQAAPVQPSLIVICPNQVIYQQNNYYYAPRHYRRRR